MRALWIGLVLFGLSLWAALASPGLSHAKQAFDVPSYDQASKLAPASDPRAPDAKLEKIKPGKASLPGDHPGLAFAGRESVAASVFSEQAAWISVAAEGSPAQAHHYSATGPPGHQPS